MGYPLGTEYGVSRRPAPDRSCGDEQRGAFSSAEFAKGSTEPSALHLPVNSHRSNFRMGGRFGPRLFTRNTEHNRDHVVAKRDDGPGVFSAGAGNIDLPMQEHVFVVGLAGSHSPHLGDLK